MENSSKAIQSAAWIMLFGMIGKVLGLIRKMMIAREFGTSIITDAFRASQTIPTLLFSAIGAALATTVIPIFTQVRSTEGTKKSMAFANNMLTTLTLVSAILAIIGIFITPILVKLVVPGFTGIKFAITVNYTRVMMISVSFVVISALLSGLLQAQRSFIIPSLVAFPLNLIAIIGIILFPRSVGGYILVYTFLIGSFAQIVWQLPSLFRKGFVLRPCLDLSDQWLHRVAVLTLPVLLGQAIQQVNIIFDRTFASWLPTGSISVLDYANRVDGLILGVVISAIATVAYPSLAEAAMSQDRGRLRATFASAMSGIGFLVIPMTAGLMVLSTPIIRFIFERGAFSPADTVRTADALFFLSIGLLAYGGRIVVSRTFFSLQDAKTPMINGIYTVVINLLLLTLFVLLLKLGVRGMALATSISGICGTFMLTWRLRRKIGRINGRRSFHHTPG